MAGTFSDREIKKRLKALKESVELLKRCIQPGQRTSEKAIRQNLRLVNIADIAVKECWNQIDREEQTKVFTTVGPVVNQALELVRTMNPAITSMTQAASHVIPCAVGANTRSQTRQGLASVGAVPP